MPRFADLATITRRDIRSFDTDAKKLVDSYHEAGWRSYMSNNTHAIFQAPDGETTASVSGHNNRAQVRRGREELKRWLRRNRKNHEHHHEPEHKNRSQEPALTTTIFTCPECPGREFKSGGALALHRQRTHDGMTCPECGEKFMGGGNSKRYNAHRLELHGITPRQRLQIKEVDGVFPCSFCSATFGTRVGLGSHQKVHKGAAISSASNGASKGASPAAAATAAPAKPLPTLRPVKRQPQPEPEPPAPVQEAMAEIVGGLVEEASSPAAESNGLDEWLGGQDPAELLTNVMAILAPPLVGQIERLRRERDELTERVEELRKKTEEFETRMAIISDAMTL